MKRACKGLCLFLSVVIVTTPLISCAPSGPHESKNGIITIDDGVMRKDMTALKFAEEMGLGENLGNTMEAFWENRANKTSGSGTTNYETCWGAIITTQEAIDGIRDAGFNTVRVPVYWGNGMQDDGEFNITESTFNRVEEIINYCRNAGLYVVINVHHYDEYILNNFPEDEAIEIFDHLWTQIAERYEEYSDYLIFEGYNEALGGTMESMKYTEEQKFAYVNRANQTFVDAVRKTGGNNSTRLLISSGYWTNIDKTTSDAFVLPTDTVEDRMMVSVHYVDNAMYWTNQIGTKKWTDYSIAQCELLKNAFTDKGIPVFVGECTSMYDEERFAENAEVTDSSECLEYMLDLMLDYGFIPVLWDVNDNFYSRTTYQIKSPTDSEVIKEISDRLAAE